MRTHLRPKTHTSSDRARRGRALTSDTIELATDSGSGLTSAEARARLDSCGYNEIVERERSSFVQLAGYFWGPIPWMIEIAALLSVLVEHWADLAIILTLLLVNAVVGFWEEYQADNAIAALKRRLALRARVKRDGTWSSIPAREVVPGDVIGL